MKTSGVQRFPVSIEISAPFDDPLPAGLDQTLTIQMISTAATFPEGLSVRLVSEAGRTVASAPVLKSNDFETTQADLSFSAPTELGDHEWMVVFDGCETDAAVLEAAETLLHFSTRAHLTSVSSWQIPSPVTAGEHYEIQVGAKCLDGCSLAGVGVHLVDAGATLRGEARLHQDTWPGTRSLHWTEMDLCPPADAQGAKAWSVQLDTAECTLPHEASSSSVRFHVVPQGSRDVTIRICECETGTPLPDVRLRIGAYRGVTDDDGVATVRVPPGEYKLATWARSYESATQELQVENDLTIILELAAISEEDPDTMWGP